ncbi:sorting nexin-5 [Tetranychus urticae]|uniref:PX domain-containing protein n=1 Tax=Tetranychus urticae TaxID=32264 RepID=T1KEW4_TETUR|nr:sorting nexin-5 [Tetranychus urticae]
MDTIDSAASVSEPANITFDDNDVLPSQPDESTKETHPEDRQSPESLSHISNVSTSSSSDIAPEPFQPKFKVKVSTNSITKDGESVIYTIYTKSLEGDSEWKVERVHDDLQQLHHNLMATVAPGFGLIMPPLPDESVTHPSQAQEKSREKLGPNTNTLIGDEWYKDCWQIQEYLRLLLNHPVFGSDPAWNQFLCSVNAPPRVKLQKTSNILGKLSENIDSRGKLTHKDCEEYFQRERDWANHYANVIKLTSRAFNCIVNARLKLCGSLSHLSTTLNLNIPGSNESQFNRQAMKLSNLFSIAIDDYKRGLEVINYNDEATLGSSLDLWSRYMEAEKEMLNRRTGLMIEYEKSNRNLDKAKPNKKDEAEKSKFEAEKLFEDCSDIARQEIKRLHKERTGVLLSAIRKYCQSQLLVNKDIHQLLLISYENLKQFRIEAY